MTKIKLCGLTRPADIAAANELRPDYIGFVFAPQSKRHVSGAVAAELRRALRPDIRAVGVFVDEEIETVARLLRSGIIDIAQLHGREGDDYIRRLQDATGQPVIKAFRVESPRSLEDAAASAAGHILLDAGAGEGRAFDWQLLRDFPRPYFLAGGLTPANAAAAVRQLHPCALDVSSGVETGGRKDKEKMAAFVAAVRKEDGYEQP